MLAGPNCQVPSGRRPNGHSSFYESRSATKKPPSPRASLTPPFDGGFYFSPIVLTANKGREERDKRGMYYYRSYATATCDGLLALLACGVPRSDERVMK